MSKCVFTKPVEGSLPSLVEKAKQAIESANGEFSGDTSGGVFRIPTPLGIIAGHYEITDGIVQISIEEKPFLIPCSLIERELDKHFNASEDALQDAEAAVYFLKGDPENEGPYSLFELIHLQLPESSLVWTPGKANWTSIETIAKEIESPNTITDGEMYWGDAWGNPGIKPGHCLPNGKRFFSARLWNIPPGQSWENTCINFPAPINNNNFLPERCKNMGMFGMWGEFEVEDSACGGQQPPHQPVSGNLVSPCRVANVYVNSQLQTDNKSSIRIHISIKRTLPEMQHCPPNTPFYTDPRLKVAAKVRSSHVGDWIYIHPHEGKKIFRGTAELTIPFPVIYQTARGEMELYFRPTPYVNGRYDFSIWLNSDGKDILFTPTDPRFDIRNGFIMKTDYIR